MTVFLDASAIVKRYVSESGSDAVYGLGLRIVVSDVSAVEVPSAIWRKQRAGEMSHDDAGLLVSAFSYDLRGGSPHPPRYASVELGSAVLDRAVELLPRYALRTGDALQLSSALRARESLEFCDTFVAFDVRLRNAAAAEGFALVPTDADSEFL